MRSPVKAPLLGRRQQKLTKKVTAIQHETLFLFKNTLKNGSHNLKPDPAESRVNISFTSAQKLITKYKLN